MENTVKKKLILTLLSLILSAIFVACTPSGGEEKPSDTEKEQNTTTVGDKVTSPAETTAPDPSTCDHSFGDFSVWRAPTCTEDGLNERVCSKCGKKDYENIGKIDHTEVTDPAVEATCQKSGLTEGSHCSVCQKVITSQKTVEKLAHQYVDGKCQNCNVPTPSEGLSFKKLSDGNYAVKGLGTCRDKIIVIPETYEGAKVVELAEYALYHIENGYAPEMIVIPDSIKNVRYNSIYFNKFFKILVGENATFAAESVCAMGGCEIICLSQKGVSSNAITYTHKDAPFVIHKGPDSLCKTDKDGFVFLESNKTLFLCGYTGNEKNVTFPDGFEGQKYVVAPYCFMADQNIESVKLGNGVLRLGEAVFTNSSVKNVDLSGSLTSLANNTFMGCKNLESIVIPDNITDIGEFVFISSGLKTATVGKNVTHIGSSAFEVKHDALLDTLYYNAVNCQKIDGMSFNGFRHVVIGKDVLVIPEEFMDSHRSLLSVTFEENSACQKIMANAFSVTAIREIVIPASVTHLYGAFEYCHNLEKISINSEKLTIYAPVFKNCGRDGTGIVLVVGSQITELPADFFKNCNVKEIIYNKNSA